MAGKVGEEHWGAQTGYRARRLARFVALADDILRSKGECRILDMGGNRDYWLDLEPVWKGRNFKFVLVNLQAERLDDPRFEAHQGDCRAMPQYADNEFDIVHSNSVLEHVGKWADMRAFAGEIRRLAPRYFVQTPNYWFPMEPHFRSLFFHWLPEPMRVNKAMRRPLGAFPKAPSLDDAQRFIEDSNLLDARRFMHLFPDGKLERERAYGFTKSLIAVR